MAHRHTVTVHIFHFLPVFIYSMSAAPALVTICSLSQRTDVLISFNSKGRLMVPKQKSVCFVSTELQITKASD